jgi:uncharacterized protein (DUF983 family)
VPYPVSKVCPSCGSGQFKRVEPDAGSGAALLNDRVCKDCGTRYTPVPPAALPYFFLLVGVGVIAAGCNSLYDFFRNWRHGGWTISPFWSVVMILVGAVAVLYGVVTIYRRWFPPKRMSDWAFGELEYQRGAWFGLLDATGAVGVHVAAGEAGPSERQRRLFTQLKARLSELSAQIEGPLAEEYLKCREASRAEYERSVPEGPRFETDYPALAQPADIWRIAHLAGIEVQPDANARVDFGLIYQIDWADPEHDLLARIKDWKVIDVGMEG